MTKLSQFVDLGSDTATCEYLSKSMGDDTLQKSGVDMDIIKARREGLVPKMVEVHGPHGTYQAVRMVKPNKDDKSGKSKSDNPYANMTQKDFKNLPGWEEDGLAMGDNDNDTYYAVNHDWEKGDPQYFKTTYGNMVNGIIEENEVGMSLKEVYQDIKSGNYKNPGKAKSSGKKESKSKAGGGSGNGGNVISSIKSKVPKVEDSHEVYTADQNIGAEELEEPIKNAMKKIGKDAVIAFPQAFDENDFDGFNDLRNHISDKMKNAKTERPFDDTSIQMGEIDGQKFGLVFDGYSGFDAVIFPNKDYLK